MNGVLKFYYFVFLEIDLLGINKADHLANYQLASGHLVVVSEVPRNSP